MMGEILGRVLVLAGSLALACDNVIITLGIGPYLYLTDKKFLQRMELK